MYIYTQKKGDKDTEREIQKDAETVTNKQIQRA